MQDVLDQVLCLEGHFLRVSQIALLYLLHSLLLADVVEGSLPHHHLVSQYPEAPDIDARVVLLALENLGRDVVEGSAVGVPSPRTVGCPAEVADLADSLNY